MPGMTANVRIQVERKDDVVRVPNAALRYQPPGEKDASPAALVRPGRTEPTAIAGTPARAFVVARDGTPRAVSIVVGLTDGTSFEVLEGDLRPGQPVIVGETTSAPRPGGVPQLRW
jgi:HlyD family secretion protein